MPGLTVPHCNVWAIAAEGGLVLVDCGMQFRGSLSNLDQAMGQCGLRLEDVRHLVCTHAHLDHCGQAAAVRERSGCELWMHPAYGHRLEMRHDREQAILRRLEIGRTGGVPEWALQRWLEERAAEVTNPDGPLTPDRRLVDGVDVETDVGRWIVVETPGHAPSHVCLFEPERRLLISGDHLMGKVSLYFDYGHSPDPAGEFLRSLDRVAALDARLGLSGHGKTFIDVPGIIAANGDLVRRQLDRIAYTLECRGPLTAFEVMRCVFGEPATGLDVTWWMNTTLCYLTHLEVGRRAHRAVGEPERWSSVGRPTPAMRVSG
jgi:glyoxylase-like metal-dependent hydrolase (beta-lactamase superfamily II)